MLRRFCGWLLYKKMGWKKVITECHPDKYIICLAPHTSNWDFILGQLYAHAEGIKNNFLMKKEWFFWPFGILLRRLGGIPVWRSKHTSMTDNLAKDWKKGFYFIAQKAEIPILLYGADYEKKIIQCTRSIVPTGDVEADMKEIKLYFKDFKGKIPKNFSIGEL